MAKKLGGASNRKKAEKIYEKSGAGAVFDAVDRGDLTHEDWRICRGCEAETPHEDGDCLVCGTNNSTAIPLQYFSVELYKVAGDPKTIKFHCLAEGEKHAKAQAKTSYPDCVIANTKESK